MAPVNLSVFVCFILLIDKGTTETIKPEGPGWPDREFRGVWVATVDNIDWPLAKTDTPDKQKLNLITLLNKMSHLNFNAIIFQVRSVGDAMYNSQLEPWSVYLTGTQGKAPSPSWDPLQFVVEEAHKRNMEVHAWFNPYRAKYKSNTTAGLAPNHMALKYPQYAYSYGDYLWMDPGSQEVQNQCFNVIMDVINRYDVDGAHMDDYFYPHPLQGFDFPDKKTYTAYKDNGGTLDLGDWRRENVNTLIQRLYKGVRSTKKPIKFGLSPGGIWKVGHPPQVVGTSTYYALGADSRKWFSEGWVDYFTPQIYWAIDPPQQSFTALLDWWLQQNKKQRHLYAGVYAGKVIVKDWPVNEIIRQVQESRKRRGKLSLGNSFFSAYNFWFNSKDMASIFKRDIYQDPALPPTMPWLGSAAPPAPSGVKVSSNLISWDLDSTGQTRTWVVYKDEAGVWKPIKFLNKDTTRWLTGDGNYVITAVDRLSNQSEGVVMKVTAGEGIVG